MYGRVSSTRIQQFRENAQVTQLDRDEIIQSNSKIAEKLLNLDDSQISLWLFRYGISMVSIVQSLAQKL